MKRNKFLMLLGSICLVLVLGVSSLVVACAPAPTPPPASAPTPAPAPAPSPAPASPTAPIVLKAATSDSTDSPRVASIHPFIERVNQRSNGELIIELVGGPEAIGRWEQTDAIRTGVIDLTVHYDDTARFPAGNSVYYTLLTGPEMRETGMYDLLAEMYKEENIAYLGMGQGYTQLRIWTNKRTNTPYDLVGQRMEGSPAWNDFLEALGIAPVGMKRGEIFTSLDQGLIDGYTTPPSDMWYLGTYEIVKYQVGPPFWRSSRKFLMNLDSFNQLPQHLQQLLMDVVIELEPEQRDRDMTVDAEFLQKVLDSGVETIEWSPADTQWFIDLSYDSMWKKIIDTHPVNGPKLRELAGR